MKNKYLFLIVLGGLLGGLQNSSLFVRAYDQMNTHPALTDEAVDFYNINYPENPLTEEEKKAIIKGAIDEDIAPRWLNHFYDPIYNQGWLGHRSSKIWAISSKEQQMEKRSLLALSPILNKTSDDWPGDFSYERALLDYAKGDRLRAFEALGHVFHLLEDANVPEHTRNDTHLPFHSSTGSPYETTMAKWSLHNFDIHKKLKREGKKPILFLNIEKYFDEIAGYSNGYFFSEDTINSKRYSKPKIIRIEELKIGKEKINFGIGIDKDSEEFRLAILDLEKVRNFVEIKKSSLLGEKDNTIILDDYWGRLSKDFILHGAGALKLFLDQAEEFKKEYERKLAEKPKRNIFSRLGLLPASTGVNIAKEFLEEKKADTVVPAVLPAAVVPEPEGQDDTVNLNEEVSLREISRRETTSALGRPTVTVAPTVTISPKPSVTEGQEDTQRDDNVSIGTPTPDTKDKSLKVSRFNTAGRIVISEVAWAGTLASAFDEWIEIYNRENYEIDLTGWTLKSDDGSLDITLFGVIKANGYFLLERTDDSTVANVSADQIFTGSLKNEGMGLILYNKNAEIIDSVGKSNQPIEDNPQWYAGNLQEKKTMERINPENPSGDPANWATFSGLSRPASDANNNPINGSPKEKNSVTVTFSTGSGGNQTVSVLLPIPESPKLKVVINELAWMGTQTSANDEWIELYNTSSKSVDLTGWSLKAADGTPNIVLASKSIDPFGFYLLERTADTTVSNISADQIYTGALENGGENLELRDKDGNLQDNLDASSAWFAGDNTSASSRKTMERINPRTSGNIATNWATNNGTKKNGADAAGNSINGTPRSQNSVYVSLKPSAILNLATNPITGFGNIVLTWSNPDDLDTLTASLSYKIRYATKSFDVLADWDGAKAVASSSLPPVGEKNATATASFSILDYNKDYYFAVRTSDGQKLSDLSNSPKYTIKSALLDPIWPMFGRNETHDLATGFQEVKNLPVKDWEYKNTLGSLGQPVVGHDGSAYAGATESGFPHFYALDDKGVKKYKYSNIAAQPSIAAVAGNKRVYFGASSNVYALDSIGSKSWQYTVGSSSGKITMDLNGTLYFTSGSKKIIAIRPDGSLKWEVNNGFTIDNSAPIVLDNGNLYIAGSISGNPTVWAYRQSDGSQVWTLDLSSLCFCGASDIVYDKNADKFYLSGGGKIAVIAKDGASFEKVTIVASATSSSLVSFSSNTIYTGFDLTSINPASGSAIFAVDKATKAKKWEYKVSSPVNSQMPLDSKENIYFATQDGKLRKVDKNGALDWEYVLPLAGSSNPISPMLDDKKGIIWGDADRIIRLK